MEMGKDSVMVIHGGGVYGEKEKSMLEAGLLMNYQKLFLSIMRRIIFYQALMFYHLG